MWYLSAINTFSAHANEVNPLNWSDETFTTTYIQTFKTHSDVAWLWAAGLTRCLFLMVSLSQEGVSLVDSSGAVRLPLYTAWLELYQKEVTSDL